MLTYSWKQRTGGYAGIWEGVRAIFIMGGSETEINTARIKEGSKGGGRVSHEQRPKRVCVMRASALGIWGGLGIKS